MKNVHIENLPLRKNYTRIPNDVNKVSDSAFTANVQYVYPKFQAQHKQFSCFGNSSTACVFALHYLHKLGFSIITSKMLSNLLFWKFASLKLDIIVLTLAKYSVQTLWNARKSQVVMLKLCNFAIVIKTIKFCLISIC